MGWRGGGGPSGPSDPDTDPTHGDPTTSGGETTGTEAETDVSRPIHLKFTAEAEDIFPMKPFTPHTETDTETGYSSQPSRKPFHRRRLPTVTKRKFLRYQKQRAKDDKKKAAPVVQTQPQIIILPSGGGGRPGPPGAPGAPGAAGGGGGASGAAAAAAASGAAGAGGAKKPEKKRRKASGITKAKKRYTDQRKIKMAEMRSLKSKRIREFAARTKKMPKKNRDEARKAYAAKANARYQEMSTKFPPARVQGFAERLAADRQAWYRTDGEVKNW